MISIGLIQNYSNVEKAIQDILKISRNQIKKSSLSKSFLTKEAQKGQILDLPEDIVNHHMINPCYDGPEVKILHEDELFIVFDKPSGIHGHPLSYADTTNCLSALRSKMNNHQLWNINNESPEKGLLYRLDQGTSGVLIYAKEETVWNDLRNNFNLAFKEKIYQAVVKGDWKGPHTLQNTIVSSGKKGHKMKVVDHHDGKMATLEILYSEYFPNKDASLLRVKLLSGVRHQIRVQLAHQGNPIIGDTLYGSAEYDRLMLHAQRYSFEYNSKTYTFDSDLDLFLFFL